MSSIVNKYRKCNIPYPYNFIYSGKLKSLSLPDVKNPEGEFYRVQKLILGTRAKHNSVWLQVVNIIFAKVVGNHLVMVPGNGGISSQAVPFVNNVYDFMLTIVLKFFVIQFGDDIPFPSDNEAPSSFSEKATVVHAPRIAPTYLNRLKKMIFYA
nr:WD-40 repeat-containing protein MSI1-like [Ipomoea trifida]